MNDSIFLLPEGHDQLSGACTFGDWVLAWRGNDVFSWSLESG